MNDKQKICLRITAKLSDGVFTQFPIPVILCRLHDQISCRVPVPLQADYPVDSNYVTDEDVASTRDYVIPSLV